MRIELFVRALEGIGISYELVERAGVQAYKLRTLGCLHLRKRGFADATVAFARAVRADDPRR